MGLNIKNERVHALAREAARVTGKTQTGAIEQALEQLLAECEREVRSDRERRKARILELAARWRTAATEPLDAYGVEDLYDSETGLPR